MKKFNNIEQYTNDKYNYNSNDDIMHLFILAGGQLDNGDINNWVKERLDLVIKICKEKKNSKIYCIGGGTYHKVPILNKYKYVIHESTSCANYLINNNIDYNNIKKEWSSYDTVANGFFSFLNFIIPLQLTKIYLITSKFHMNRVKIIFNFMKNLFKLNIEIIYLETNNNMDYELLTLREEREKESIKNFNIEMNNINNINDFFDWFYIKHKAYSSINYKKNNINNEVIKTY